MASMTAKLICKSDNVNNKNQFRIEEWLVGNVLIALFDVLVDIFERTLAHDRQQYYRRRLRAHFIKHIYVI